MGGHFPVICLVETELFDEAGYDSESHAIEHRQNPPPTLTSLYTPPPRFLHSTTKLFQTSEEPCCDPSDVVTECVRSLDPLFLTWVCRLSQRFYLFGCISGASAECYTTRSKGL